jgi:signal transduction histidine kinase
VELCGYRLVQEALTNVIKHTPLPASAEVTIAYEPEALEVMISSHGAGPLPAACPDGQGLLGMRERVALAGGTLHAGPQDARTWVVRARLPIEDVQ